MDSDSTPVQSGDRVLELQIFAEMEDGDEPILIRTFRESIVVEVNRGYTISAWLKTWEPLTGLSVPVIGGAIVWFARWWRAEM